MVSELGVAFEALQASSLPLYVLLILMGIFFSIDF